MEGVKKQQRPLQQLVVVVGQGDQAVKQGFEKSRVVWKRAFLHIDAFDQFADFGRRRIEQAKAARHDLKGDQFALVGKFRAAQVKGDFVGRWRFIGLKKADNGVRVDKSAHQPETTQPVDVRMRPGRPDAVLIGPAIERRLERGKIRIAQLVAGGVQEGQGLGGCARGEKIALPQGFATLAQLAKRRRPLLAPIVGGQLPGRGGREIQRLRLNPGKFRGDLRLKQLLDLVIRHAFDAGALDGDGLAAQGVDLADQPGDVFQQIDAVGQNLQAGFERRRAAGCNAPPDAHPGLGVDGGNRVREEYPFFIHNEQNYVISITMSR